MLATTFSSVLVGLDAIPVAVEVDAGPGASSFALVGLPEAAVRESRDRVRAALRNSGYDYPRGRITVNLAPADVRKEGSAFDLPIAVALLAAQGVVPRAALRGRLILGELSLDGGIKAVRGALPIAAGAAAHGFEQLLLPARNAPEAGVVTSVAAIPVNTLADVVNHLTGRRALAPLRVDLDRLFSDARRPAVDFAEVRGQEHVKRALEVAAAGGHNVLMVGPPGSGKTMLARRLPTILPSMTLEEAIETTRVYSVLGLMNGQALVIDRPFRAPHHTISDVGLVGGGAVPRPGEVSLAHHGVLFLDELPEFRKNVLEVLRQPLEEMQITISRAAGSVTYPANLMLVAAMNPCPCGYLTDPQRNCICHEAQIHRYRSRVSGPLLDRIDIQVEVPAVPFRDLCERRPAEPSARIRERVELARRRQLERYGGAGRFCNAQATPRELDQFCVLDGDARRLLENALRRLGLSARAYTRILKVARTIADLAGEDRIGAAHVAEAVQYRSLDRGA